MTPLGPKDVISGFNEFDIATIFRWKSIASINKFPPTQIFTKWKAPSLQFLLHYTFVSPKALPSASFITISFLLKPGGQTHLCNGKRLCCLGYSFSNIFFLPSGILLSSLIHKYIEVGEVLKLIQFFYSRNLNKESTIWKIYSTQKFENSFTHFHSRFNIPGIFMRWEPL